MIKAKPVKNDLWWDQSKASLKKGGLQHQVKLNVFSPGGGGGGGYYVNGICKGMLSVEPIFVKRGSL